MEQERAARLRSPRPGARSNAGVEGQRGPSAAQRAGTSGGRPASPGASRPDTKTKVDIQSVPSYENGHLRPLPISRPSLAFSLVCSAADLVEEDVCWINRRRHLLAQMILEMSDSTCNGPSVDQEPTCGKKNYIVEELKRLPARLVDNSNHSAWHSFPLAAKKLD
eukprot:CAMPEP_0117539488 /NCGR_PEP_ID=MMETSP0784-20121206/43010_1 /TAXON_ID=39447 /ORGANISM="" /LENGTH=164 /DNA_ID=CAMNT_0005336115 /DNA_START=31 /DNA_END=526 /DNA_ORIENTATION=-